MAPVQPAPPPPLDATAAPTVAAWKLLRLIRLPNPGAASLDRRGALYVADADNNLRQYGPEGLPLNTYAPAQPGHVAQVEAWNVTTTLVFNDDRQQLVLLDRFLTPITEVRLADYWMAPCAWPRWPPTTASGCSMKATSCCANSTPTPCAWCRTRRWTCIIGRSRPDFRFIRQYQNNTYLVDRSTGMYVFDNLGNYKKKLPFTGLSMVGFRGDELYYLEAGRHALFSPLQPDRAARGPAAGPRPRRRAAGAGGRSVCVYFYGGGGSCLSAVKRCLYS